MGIPKTTPSFCDLLWGLTQWFIYSGRTWGENNEGKRYVGQNPEGTRLRLPGALIDSLPVDALNSSSNKLWQCVWDFIYQGSSPEHRCSRFCWGSVTWVPSAWQAPKHQVPRRKADVQCEPCHLYKQVRTDNHSSSQVWREPSRNSGCPVPAEGLSFWNAVSGLQTRFPRWSLCILNIQKHCFKEVGCFVWLHIGITWEAWKTDGPTARNSELIGLGCSGILTLRTVTLWVMFLCYEIGIMTSARECRRDQNKII